MNRTALIAAAASALAAAACDQEDLGDSLARAYAEPAPGAAPIALLPGPDGAAAFIDCMADRGAGLVSAHRGGPAPGIAENDVEGMATLYGQFPTLMEIDVRRTADGELVLLHDSTLDRTTTCSGDIAARDLDALSACALEDAAGADTGGDVDTLAKALAWADGKTIIQLDVKARRDFADVLTLVREAGASDRVIMISYTFDAAEQIARLAPTVALTATIDDVADLAELESRGVDLDRLIAWTGTREPDPALFAALDARDIPVAFGTLGGRNSIDNAIAASGDDSRYLELERDGVDLLATDRPRAAAPLLATRAELRSAAQACAQN